MKPIFGLAAAAGIFLAGAASAATVSNDLVTLEGTDPGGVAIGINDFVGAGKLLDGYNFFYDGSTTDLSFTFSSDVKVSFSGVAQESGWDNSFTVAGLGTLSESDGGGAGTLDDYGTLMTTYLSGTVLSGSDLSFDSSGGSVNDMTTAAFGVFGFLDGDGKISRLFLAHDDGGAGPNDNHDDFIIEMTVSAVPLPAAAWMLIAGLGALGVAARRRG